MPALVRTKRSVTTPAIADPVILKRLQQLGMTFQQYINSLIAYDCWAEKPHLLTGQACTGTREDEAKLWSEVVADFGKPDKTGSYFEHRVARLVIERLRGPGTAGE